MEIIRDGLENSKLWASGMLKHPQYFYTVSNTLLKYDSGRDLNSNIAGALPPPTPGFLNSTPSFLFPY